MCWIVLLLSPIVWLEFIEMIIFFYFALFGVAVVFQALCLTLWDPMNGSMPGFLVLHISWSLFRLMSIESVMLSNHLILCCPLLLLPSVFPSIKVFSSGLALLIRWTKHCNFSINISLSLLIHPSIYVYFCQSCNTFVLEQVVYLSYSYVCVSYKV